ncbi:amiloride-sensitive amine oxidase [copper-containing]-like [Branchiostoma floridae]|uniref:Amine oxidase n=2 Tax=Branchiostoma floridae TaxID=7739 RepID=A0A9J7LC83_BRAFL|nr:amiloride-sensitive amine oxidase [copper-containing]-like [Branchiostoma floridae]
MEMKEGGEQGTSTAPKSSGTLWNTVSFWRVVSGLLFLVCIALAVALGVVSGKGGHGAEEGGSGMPVVGDGQGGTIGPCPTGMATEAVDEDSPALYDDLTAEELRAVREYLLGQSGLDITPWEEASINDNYIYGMELHLPLKAEALAYLDNNGPRPERQALVTVYGGGRTQPVVEQYVVGPLPDPTRHETYAPPGRKNPIPWHARAPETKEYALLIPMLTQATKETDRILKESFGYTYYNCSSRCLTLGDTAPRGFTSGERRTWFRFMRNLEGKFLHPVGFMIQINHLNMDPAQWRIERVFYNGQYFESTAELVRSYDDGTARKAQLPVLAGDEALFSSFRRRGDPQPSRPLRAPELIEPDGRRYKVQGRHVEYMGWSFNWRLSTTQGLQLYDIRMKNERVVYELGLQDAGTWYSGTDPLMLAALYVDNAWPVAGSFELLPGIDCPKTATFFDALHQQDIGKPRRFRNAVCAFELDTGIPLRRHFDSDDAGGYTFYGGMADHVLVLRHINVVYNYDFVYDYIFHQNGVLEVKVSLTGYLQPTFYTQDQDPYGYRMWANQIGNHHQHFFNYKVDLDVVNVQNRFETVDILLENITNPERPELRHIQTRIQRSLRTTEKEAAVQYDFNRPKYYNFYSEEQKNRFDAHRGYRLQLNGIAKSLLPRGEWAPVNGAAWMDYQVAVTRRKDSEPSSSSIFNQNDLYDPVVNFQSFIDDDENIVDEDLVAWVTLAAHHLPHSEDYPVTATAGNQLQFFIRPFHFYDEDPSVASSNAVRITPSDDFRSATVDRFGTPEMTSCFPRTSPVSFNGTWREV